MRSVQNPQPSLGQIPIEDIQFDPRSRDDIPAVLLGIQSIYTDSILRDKVFQLLELHLLCDPDSAGDRQDCPTGNAPVGIDPWHGRPGMDLWNILVLGLLKQGLNCDYDRLHELASKHLDVRRMLGCSDVQEGPFFSQRTVVRNVSLLTPDLLAEVNRIVVGAGHDLVGHDGSQSLQGRCDSVVVETDVHYPTDVSLLWDAVRSLIRTMAALCERHEVGGWRQAEHLKEKLKRYFNRVRTSRQRARSPRRVRAYLQLAVDLAARAGESLEELAGKGVAEEEVQAAKGYLDHVLRLADQVERRVLQKETIPQEEKIYSIFEEHTRWIAKGKAGQAVELGVPVSIVESEHQFVLHWEVMWTEEDVDMLPGLIEAAQAKYPELSGCSFDKGFYSPSNRRLLDRLLERNTMPKKGHLGKEDRERESGEGFREARRAHPAVESAINNLEQRGFDRVLAEGADGFERMVGLSVVAANVHRIGLILQRRAREKQKRERLRVAA